MAASTTKSSSSSRSSKAAAAAGSRPTAEIRRVADLLKQVSDPTRLQVLMLLSEKERNVSELCADLGTQSQPAVSHHLALLAARPADRAPPLRQAQLLRPDRRRSRARPGRQYGRQLNSVARSSTRRSAVGQPDRGGRGVSACSASELGAAGDSRRLFSVSSSHSRSRASPCATSRSRPAWSPTSRSIDERAGVADALRAPGRTAGC